MDILANARAHFSDKLNSGLKCIEVPEWGTDGEPAKIYYGAETLEQRDKYFAGIAAQQFESFAMVIITRAKTAEGRRLFHDKDLIHFKKALDPDVVVRVASEMFADEDVDVDTLGKS